MDNNKTTIFNKKTAMIFIFVSLAVTVALEIYVWIDWFFINSDIRRMGGLAEPLNTIYHIYLKLYFPVTQVVYMEIRLIEKTPALFSVDLWIPAFVTYLTLGSLWWYLVGGFFGALIDLVRFKKNKT